MASIFVLVLEDSAADEPKAPAAWTPVIADRLSTRHRFESIAYHDALAIKASDFLKHQES